MKSLVLLFILAFSNICLSFVPLTCEMTDVENKSNKISISIEKSDLEDDDDQKYAFKQTEQGIDDLYWMAVELRASSKNEGTLDIVITDENDEVGSFYCDFSERDKKTNQICSEPIMDENGKYKYDIKCFFN